MLTIPVLANPADRRSLSRTVPGNPVSVLDEVYLLGENGDDDERVAYSKRSGYVDQPQYIRQTLEYCSRTGKASRDRSRRPQTESRAKILLCKLISEPNPRATPLEFDLNVSIELANRAD